MMETDMPIINNMVAGAVCYVCLIVMASAAQKLEPSFNMPTCDEFKDRLTHTKKRAGIIVPDAEYEAHRNNDDSSITWTISNYLDFDANLQCKDAMFRSMEIEPDVFAEFDVAVAQRESNMIGASIRAWTGWTKARVMVLVNSLNTQVADDMRKGRIYGEGRGNASFDLPGGAIIRVSGGGNGLHMILNSADEEQRMLRKNKQQE
jgi:hypothetical protein